MTGKVFIQLIPFKRESKQYEQSGMDKMIF